MNAGWLENIEVPWLTFVEEQAVGCGLERRAVFEEALDVDFAILDRDGVVGMTSTGWPPELAAVLARGFRFILDKDGLESSMQGEAFARPPASLPAPEEFLSLCSDFLYHALWAAKKLRRGELWVAKSCADGYMKWRLLRMLEWHARVTHGSDYETWHGGRFLETWADPCALVRLRRAFSHYEGADIRRALLETMDLFRWLAEETADSLDYRYPEEAHSRITAWLSARS